MYPTPYWPRTSRSSRTLHWSRTFWNVPEHSFQMNLYEPSVGDDRRKWRRSNREHKLYRIAVSSLWMFREGREPRSHQRARRELSIEDHHSCPTRSGAAGLRCLSYQHSCSFFKPPLAFYATTLFHCYICTIQQYAMSLYNTASPPQTCHQARSGMKGRGSLLGTCGSW